MRAVRQEAQCRRQQHITHVVPAGHEVQQNADEGERSTSLMSTYMAVTVLVVISSCCRNSVVECGTCLPLTSDCKKKSITYDTLRRS